MINLLIANVTGSLDQLMPRIKAAHDRAVETTNQLLKLDDVDIIIVDDPSSCIPEVGTGGFTPNRHLVYCHMDPSVDVAEDEIYASLCHELNHARRYDGEGYGKTLFESMIFEGLAIAFEAEVSGGQSFMTRALESRQDTQALIDRTKQDFDTTDFIHYTWFINDMSGRLPRWAGYEIGYYLVKKYMETTGKKASELVLEPAANFA